MSEGHWDSISVSNWTTVTAVEDRGSRAKLDILTVLNDAQVLRVLPQHGESLSASGEERSIQTQRGLHRLLIPIWTLMSPNNIAVISLQPCTDGNYSRKLDSPTQSYGGITTGRGKQSSGRLHTAYLFMSGWEEGATKVKKTGLFQSQNYVLVNQQESFKAEIQYMIKLVSRHSLYCLNIGRHSLKSIPKLCDLNEHYNALPSSIYMYLSHTDFRKWVIILIIPLRYVAYTCLFWSVYKFYHHWSQTLALVLERLIEMKIII